jgi:hypothetical protein
MTASRVVRVAARNNAEWCDAFCRTYAIDGHFDAESWTSRQRTPPLYPDAVTLAPGVTPDRLLSRMDASDGCSLKDSFADLDLTAEGFRPLFYGEWLLWDDPADAPAAASGGWSVVQTRERLGEWESAWGRPPERPGFFRPALLANATIAVIARSDGDRIVAGAVANRSAEAIGLSNVFARDGDRGSAWSEAARAARARWGAMPVLGYDSGAGLEDAHRAGFESIGELAVWLKEPPAIPPGMPPESGRRTG